MRRGLNSSFAFSNTTSDDVLAVAPSAGPLLPPSAAVGAGVFDRRDLERALFLARALVLLRPRPFAFPLPFPLPLPWPFPFPLPLPFPFPLPMSFPFRLAPLLLPLPLPLNSRPSSLLASPPPAASMSASPSASNFSGAGAASPSAGGWRSSWMARSMTDGKWSVSRYGMSVSLQPGRSRYSANRVRAGASVMRRWYAMSNRAWYQFSSFFRPGTCCAAGLPWNR